jgi:sugar lactone lactonase YvrE
VGLALAPDGRIFVTDWGDHRVKVFNPDGTIYAVFGGYGTLAGQFNRPTGVAFLPDGRILVTDRENGRIQIFRYQREK